MPLRTTPARPPRAWLFQLGGVAWHLGGRLRLGGPWLRWSVQHPPRHFPRPLLGFFSGEFLFHPVSLPQRAEGREP